MRITAPPGRQHRSRLPEEHELLQAYHGFIGTVAKLPELGYKNVGVYNVHIGKTNEYLNVHKEFIELIPGDMPRGYAYGVPLPV